LKKINLNLLKTIMDFGIFFCKLAFHSVFLGHGNYLEIEYLQHVGLVFHQEFLAIDDWLGKVSC
jgi:hypothetical protein